MGNITKSTVFALFLCILCLYKAGAQPLHWESIGGPHDGYNLSSVFPNIIFAWSFRSTDAGITWVKMPEIESKLLRPITSNDSTIFATNGYNFSRSFDHGLSWQGIDGLPGEGFGLVARGKTVYAATTDGSTTLLYRSNDNGDHWSYMTEYAARGNLLIVSDSFFLVGTFQNGMYKVFWDSAYSLWNWKYAGLPNLSYPACYAVNKDKIYVGTQSGLYSTTNQGKSWQHITLPKPNAEITEVVAKNSFLFVIEDVHGAFRSQDGGRTWTSITQGINQNVYSLSFSDTILFASGEEGTFRSTNYGNSWESANPGLPYANIFALTTNNNVPIISSGGPTFSYNDTIKKWMPYDNHAIAIGGITRFIKGRKGIFGIGGYVYELNRSTDNGASWDLCGKYDSIDCGGLLAIQLIDTVLYAFTGIGIYESRNNGDSWISIGKNLVGRATCSAVIGKTLFTATFINDTNAIYSSTDFGLSWTIIDTLPSHASNLFVSGSAIFITTDSNGIYRSLDSGKSFYSITGLLFRTVHSITGNDKIIFVSADTSGVYYSINHGDTWIQSNTGLSNTNIHALSLGRSKLFAATDSGVFQTTIADTLAFVFSGSSSSSQLFLYPNPSQDELTILYMAKANSGSEIEIFDLLGNRVLSKSVNSVTSAENEVVINVHNYPSGSYFLYVTTGNEIASSKFSIAH